MSETIADTKARLEAFALESNPNADIAPGTVLSELIIKFASTLHNPIKNDILALDQSNSIITALDSVTDTYSEAIDNIASNYSLSRSQGLKSTGKLKVIINSGDTFYLPANTVFTQPVVKLNYLTTANYRITTNPKNVDDLALKKINASNQYYFILPVQAEKAGSQYKLTDRIALDVGTGVVISNFVTAQAQGNFTDGLDVETDKELIARFKTGLSNKSLLTKNSILSRVREEYPNLKDISLATVNDPELIRPKQNLFGTSTLGMTDVYVKTTFGLETSQLSIMATKTGPATWTLSLGVDDAAGFYRILSILPQNQQLTGSLEFTPTYNYSTSGYQIANLVNNLYEGRFTKYQTADVTFTFDELTLDGVSQAYAIGTKVPFDVWVVGQPDIKGIQDFLLSNDERITCADYLVKAALPCFVTVNLTIVRNDPTVDFPVDLLKQDIFKYINSLSFGDSVHASAIINICHKYDIKNVRLPIQLTGAIYTDHSTLLTISSTDVLTIPTKLDLGVSPKTTIFVSNYFDTLSDPGVNITDAIGIEIV